VVGVLRLRRFRHRRTHWLNSPATARLPRLVARGYPAAVPGPVARDSFLLGFRRLGKPWAWSIR